MTLRDWFAGRALTEAMTQHTLNCQDRGTLPDWTDSVEREQVAGIAYLMADAMLAARQK